MRELVYSRQFLPALSRYADRLAVADGTYRATFAEHADRVFRLVDALKTELGSKPGAGFAMMATNSHQHLEIYHAALLGAGVLNPLNLRFAPAELAFVLKNSGATVCFVDSVYAQVIDKVRHEAGLETVVLLDESATDAPHDVTYEALLAAAHPHVPEEPEEDTPALLMYTGGTTGLPKGVLLDQRALTLNTYHAQLVWDFDPGEVYLLQTPMFHAASLGGIAAVPLLGGALTFVPTFEAGAVLDVIERERVTSTIMVPTMIAITLGHPAYAPARLASLRSLTYGASPMPASLLERLLRELPDLQIFQGYGMTESAGLLTALQPHDHVAGGELLRSTGRAVPGVVLSIQDSDGQLQPVGEIGEVCARGGNLMREYWRAPEQTEAAFKGGWYHTGDAGRLDAAGYLFLVDRVKDMIVSGGENVYSVEVENALASHAAVAQVAVIGIPDETWGEAVHAICVLHAGVRATQEELRAHVRERIAGYKVPKTVELRDTPLPMSGALKVLKRELRKPYWQGRESGIN